MIILYFLVYPLVSLTLVTLAFLISGGVDSTTNNFATDFGVFSLFILLPCSLGMGVVGGIHLVILHLYAERGNTNIYALSLKTGLVFGALILLLFSQSWTGAMLFGVPAFLTSAISGLILAKCQLPLPTES